MHLLIELDSHFRYFNSRHTGIEPTGDKVIIKASDGIHETPEQVIADTGKNVQK